MSNTTVTHSCDVLTEVKIELNFFMKYQILSLANAADTHKPYAAKCDQVLAISALVRKKRPQIRSSARARTHTTWCVKRYYVMSNYVNNTHTGILVLTRNISEPFIN